MCHPRTDLHRRYPLNLSRRHIHLDKSVPIQLNVFPQRVNLTPCAVTRLAPRLCSTVFCTLFAQGLDGRLTFSRILVTSKHKDWMRRDNLDSVSIVTESCARPQTNEITDMCTFDRLVRKLANLSMFSRALTPTCLTTAPILQWLRRGARASILG